MRWSIGLDTLRALIPFVATNSVAPREMASAFLLSELENTTTSQPILEANWMAR